ncbi:MAG: isoprenylcysteine carboxylmethyltransferase family protein [Chitinophagales bacterium]
MIGITVLWVVFGLLHSLLADLKVKAWFQGKLGKAFGFYRIAYNMLFVSLLGVISWLLLTQPAEALLFATSTISTVAAALIAVVGFGLMAASMAKFDMGEFLGWSYLNPQPNKQVETLRTDGLYKYVRHPLYFGTFTFVLGLFLLWPTAINLLSVGFLYLYTYIGALLEERKLEKIFGSDYSEYKKKVKMLVPYIF